jgi:DNA-directed RNA polymerase subunit M/transcription elongation factor TFIIS
LSTPEQQSGEMSSDSDTTANHTTDGTSSRTTDIASGRKTARQRVTLSAIVQCPSCGNTSKPEWMNKSRHGDSYATTVFCEHCGSLITVWAMHVDAQIVAHS